MLLLALGADYVVWQHNVAEMVYATVFKTLQGGTKALRSGVRLELKAAARGSKAHVGNLAQAPTSGKQLWLLIAITMGVDNNNFGC